MGKRDHEYIDAYSDNIIPYRVHSNPLTVTHKNMDALWAEYQGWLVARFGNKASSAQQGEVLARDWLLSSPALSPDGTRWYIRFDGYTRAQLVGRRRAASRRTCAVWSRMRGSASRRMATPCSPSRKSAATTTTTTM